MKQTAGNAQVYAVPNGDFKPVYVESKFKKRHGKTSLFLIAIQRNEAESGRKMQGVDAIGVFGEGIYAALELLLFALPEGFQSGII